MPARAKSVRYGPDPPTERDQPVRSSTVAADAPCSEPSSPWRCAHQARNVSSSTDVVAMAAQPFSARSIARAAAGWYLLVTRWPTRGAPSVALGGAPRCRRDRAPCALLVHLGLP